VDSSLSLMTVEMRRAISGEVGRRASPSKYSQEAGRAMANEELETALDDDFEDEEVLKKE
jgi:hypothetical protein